VLGTVASPFPPQVVSHAPCVPRLRFGLLSHNRAWSFSVMLNMFRKEAGTGPICRDGLKGAWHTLDLCPFPPQNIAQVSRNALAPCG
jgi:hypothetical protein